MLANYLIVSVRNLLKDRLYFVINTIGLAVGIATCFLIYSWISYETSFERHLPDKELLYRIVTHWDDVETDAAFATTYPMVRTRVLSQIPEIELSTRLYNTGFLGSKTKITYGDFVHTNSVLYYGDSTFFDVFQLPFISGNRKALTRPNAIVITEKMAGIFFQNDDPLGKTILVGSDREFEITGVIENLPANSHFQFDMIASMAAHPWIADAEKSLWSGISFHTYVKLKPLATPTNVEKKIAAVLDHFPNDPKGYGKELDLRLQPVQDIHLQSSLKFELLPNGNRVLVYTFITIAILVLVVATVNYINLATARYTQRFKEVGIRKVMGASRSQLMLQFLSESMVLALGALVISIILIELVRPVLQSISDIRYFSLTPYSPAILLPLILTALVIGFFSGLLPAFIISSVQAVKLFKPAPDRSWGRLTLRQALVVFQFSVSIILTICTAITVQQIYFLRHQDLGYDRNQVAILNIGYSGLKNQYDVLKSELARSPAIAGVAATSQLPTNVQTAENIDVPGRDAIGVNCVSVDPDFFSVLEIELISDPRLIGSLRPNDSIHTFVLNETAIRQIGWSEAQALAQKMSIRHGNQQPGPVAGIVRDFHFQSLHNSITPLVFEFTPSSYQYLLVKIKPDQTSAALDDMKKAWKEIAGNLPFEFSFLDEAYNRLYQQELLTSNLFTAFSMVALIIALLGLFGLSSFAVSKRIKEVGIRKILGADFWSILTLLSRDFGKLLLVALLVAVPVSLYLGSEWLSRFAYRVEINVLIFIGAIAANFVLAFFTISYHGLQAAMLNPTETLRSE